MSGGPDTPDRQAREAAALRANLLKRKAQARGRTAPATEANPASATDPAGPAGGDGDPADEPTG